MNAAYLAEYLGTFFLVFAGTGSAVVNADSKGAISHTGIALTFGLLVMTMIYAFGDISGAHMNPAVTIAMTALGKLSVGALLPYVACQVAGAVTASFLLRSMFPHDTTSLGATLPVGPVWRSFVLEFVLTAMLMFVIFGVTSGSKIRGELAGIAVGGLIALEALFAGPISGASMNPARSLAPALVSGNRRSLWLYLIAPTLGALVAAALLPSLSKPLTVSPATPLTGAAMPFDHNVSHSAKLRVMFVCVENSNRSQMAEAFARLLGGEQVEAYSSGSRPSGRVNPKAIAAMQELGYDLTTHTSKAVSACDGLTFDAVVTMGCGDACPNVPARHRRDWQIPDPREMSPAEFNQVRDQIRQQVAALLDELRAESV
jgi:aquaporin NIP